jgi:hypothetical protein
MIKFDIPLQTKNPLNGPQGRTRAAMFGKAARRKKERNTAKLCTLSAIRSQLEYWPLNDLIMRVRGKPYTCTISRLSAGELDGDGLQASLKSIRDGIADACGVNDNDPRVVWAYSQRKVKRGTYGVEVEIT